MYSGHGLCCIPRKQKLQGKSLEIIDTEEIFFPSGGNIAAIATTAPLNKQKNISQKYGGISPLCDIATVAMTAAVEMKKIITKMKCHWWK